MMLDTGFLILDKNKKRYSILEKGNQASSIVCPEADDLAF